MSSELGPTGFNPETTGVERSYDELTPQEKIEAIVATQPKAVSMKDLGGVLSVFSINPEDLPSEVGTAAVEKYKWNSDMGGREVPLIDYETHEEQVQNPQTGEFTPQTIKTPTKKQRDLEMEAARHLSEARERAKEGEELYWDLHPKQTLDRLKVTEEEVQGFPFRSDSDLKGLIDSLGDF